MFSVKNGTVEAIHPVNPGVIMDANHFERERRQDYTKEENYDISLGSKTHDGTNDKTRALPASGMTYEFLSLSIPSLEVFIAVYIQIQYFIHR